MNKKTLREAIKNAEFDPTSGIWPIILQNEDPIYYEGKMNEAAALAKISREDTNCHIALLDDVIRYAILTKVALRGGLGKKKRPSRRQDKK